MTTIIKETTEETYFVVRDTDHPMEDLQRNWSAFAGGSCNGEDGGATPQEAAEAYEDHNGSSFGGDFRHHPAHGECVAVDYEGLGAFYLESETVEEAINEATSFREGLAECMESGDGHFDAAECVAFHKVSDGRYIFELI